jgi:hypothetical protein
VDFKDQVAAQIADAERKDIREYRGGDWWQLGPEEELVFAVDFRRFPRSITALALFESFHDIVAPEDNQLDPDAVAAERKRRPDLMKRDFTLDGFQHFARDYAGMTFREAHAVYTKNKFWQIRQGITTYSDEAPAPEKH